MTNFSSDANSCRVEIWNPRGDGFKWYTTIKVEFRNYHEEIHQAFRKALEGAIDQITGRKPSGVATPRSEGPLRNRYAGMLAICDEPWNEHAHPVCIRIPEQWES